MKRAKKSLAAADFHTWRKETKYHWYQLRLLRRCAADRFKPARSLAKHLGALLGAHHDLEVLAAHVEARLTDDADLARSLRGLAAKRQDALAADALTLGADVFGTKPDAWREALMVALTAAAEEAARPTQPRPALV